MQRPSKTVVGALVGVLAAVIALGGLVFGSDTAAPPDVRGGAVAAPEARGAGDISEAELPATARETLALIDRGGPFPYRQDGSTFRNREGLLPERPMGFYREYTVDKPGSDDRGPWRIVTGGADPEVYYWTADHYESFTRIAR